MEIQTSAYSSTRHSRQRQHPRAIAQGTWRAGYRTGTGSGVLRAPGSGTHVFSVQLEMESISCVQAKDIDLVEGAEKGTLTQSQMELVTCFAPDRVHKTSGYVSVAQQHLPVCIESSVDALCSVFHGTVS